jgi:acyl-coenzyme A thioesterase PaaI-like protein
VSDLGNEPAQGDVADLLGTAGRVLHAGRTVIVVQTDLFDGAGQLAAQVTQTQAVLAGQA